MKPIFFVLIALWVVFPSYANEPSADDMVMAQEKAWAAALLAGKLDVVDALMHRDFRLIRAYSDAPPIDKAAYLGMTGMSASMIEVTSVRIDIVDKVAVAQATWTLDWEQEGVGKLPPHFQLTDVWIKSDDGTWQILSRVSQLAEAPPTGGE